MNYNNHFKQSFRRNVMHELHFRSRRYLSDVAHRTFLIVHAHSLKNLDNLTTIVGRNLKVSPSSLDSLKVYEETQLENISFVRLVYCRNGSENYTSSPLIIDYDEKLKRLRFTIECNELILGYKTIVKSRPNTIVQSKEFAGAGICRIIDELEHLTMLKIRAKYE
mgnify:CR=1 FL=1